MSPDPLRVPQTTSAARGTQAIHAERDAAQQHRNWRRFDPGLLPCYREAYWLPPTGAHSPAALFAVSRSCARVPSSRVCALSGTFCAPPHRHGRGFLWFCATHVHPRLSKAQRKIVQSPRVSPALLFPGCLDVYIGGAVPRPTFTRGVRSVPSGCLTAAGTKMWAPGVSSLLSPGT